jgi:hypothetical protein
VHLINDLQLLKQASSFNKPKTTAQKSYFTGINKEFEKVKKNEKLLTILKKLRDG